jgi:hypothetical protein
MFGSPEVSYGSTPLQKTDMFGRPTVSYHQTHSARDWLSILRTPYTTQNLQRKHRTYVQMTTKARKRTKNSDHKTNDSIRHELQTDNILDKIDEYRRNWLLHLQRIPQNRIPLILYHYSPQEKGTIGRPKKR